MVIHTGREVCGELRAGIYCLRGVKVGRGMVKDCAGPIVCECRMKNAECGVALARNRAGIYCRRMVKDFRRVGSDGLRLIIDALGGDSDERAEAKAEVRACVAASRQSAAERVG